VAGSDSLAVAVRCRRVVAGTDVVASSAVVEAGRARVSTLHPPAGERSRQASPPARMEKSWPSAALPTVAWRRPDPSRPRDRHPGQLSDSSPGSGHRPLALVVWAEAVETLTWAEKGTPSEPAALS
jgi:hypothetical protein